MFLQRLPQAAGVCTHVAALMRQGAADKNVWFSEKHSAR